MSFLLLGARGTGKTWLLEEKFRAASSLWINLLENRDFFRYQATPGLLRQEVTEIVKQEPTWIIIDEVQRVPERLGSFFV